jgi:hypothetical protein
MHSCSSTNSHPFLRNLAGAMLNPTDKIGGVLIKQFSFSPFGIIYNELESVNTFKHDCKRAGTHTHTHTHTHIYIKTNNKLRGP